MGRRDPASVTTERKAQPCAVLSPPGSKRDGGFGSFCGSQGYAWLVGWVLKKKLGKEANRAALCTGCIPSRGAIRVPRGRQVKPAAEEQSSIPYTGAGEAFSIATCYPPLFFVTAPAKASSRTGWGSELSATPAGAGGAGNPKAFPWRSALTCHPCRAQRKPVRGSPSVPQLRCAHTYKPRHPPSSLMLAQRRRESSWCGTQQ